MFVCMYTHVHTHVHTERERDIQRERERDRKATTFENMCGRSTQHMCVADPAPSASPT